MKKVYGVNYGKGTKRFSVSKNFYKLSTARAYAEKMRRAGYHNPRVFCVNTR